jgi:hypothetical protein
LHLFLKKNTTLPLNLSPQDGNGDVQVHGGTTLRCCSALALSQALDVAHALRSTAATARNAQSSRSHAIVTLEFVNLPAAAAAAAAAEVRVHGRATDGGAAEGVDAAAAAAATAAAATAAAAAASASARGVGVGTLRLVDLAGSERNEDSLQHRGADRTRESSSINESLAALKDCFRAITEKDVEQEVVRSWRPFRVFLQRVRAFKHVHRCFTRPFPHFFFFFAFAMCIPHPDCASPGAGD